MNKTFVSIVAIFIVSVYSFAQKDAVTKPTPEKPAVSAAASTPLDVAKTALAAHGGDKLKNLKSLVMKGSVDMNVFNQTMPGAFSTAFNGEKYFFEISSVQSMKQVFDGNQTYSSQPGFFLPPVTSIGFPILVHIGDKGYIIAALDESKKKRHGFRVTAPDGFYTDFLVDEKSGQVKGYESAFEFNGRVVTTSAVIDEVTTVDGVIVPKKYSQRFDLGTLTAYANFKAKDILVNPEMAADAFAIPK